MLMSPAWTVGHNGAAAAMSHEGAQAGDSLADDQILHLIGARYSSRHHVAAKHRRRLADHRRLDETQFADFE
jgi:hypothetical protein